MANLVYYKNENEEFKEAFGKVMTRQETEMVYLKLCRHFKLRKVSIEWTSGRNHPCCNAWRICFNLDWNNFGVFCHELAHLYQFQYPKYRGDGNRFHNKKHRRIMKRMVNYCQNKNWFEIELKRRTEPKPEKPEPSKDELRQIKIKRFEQSTKKCLSKIKRYQNLIKKNNRRIVHLKRLT